MADSTPPAAPTQPPRFGEVLMLSDTPVLAGVIMALAQPFAQLRETIGFPQWTPLLVAAAASLLIAVYHVQYRRRSRGREAWLLTPLITLILFSAAVGANNLVDAARQGGAKAGQAAAVTDQAELLRETLRLAQEQLENERRLRETLLKELGVSPPAEDAGAPHKGSTLTWPALTALANWLIQNAAAETEAERRKRVEAALKKYQEEQQKLKAKEEQLKQETPPREQQKSAPLWKTW
jgi:hypothetical protein